MPEENFPKTHDEAIDIICNSNDVSVINFNYRMLQMQAPCQIIKVSDVVFDITTGIRLYGEAVKYRPIFLSK